MMTMTTKSRTVGLRLCWILVLLCLVLAPLSACSGPFSSPNPADSLPIGHSYQPGDKGYVLVDGMDDPDIHLGLIGNCQENDSAKNLKNLKNLKDLKDLKNPVDSAMKALNDSLSRTYASSVYTPIDCPTKASQALDLQIKQLDGYLSRQMTAIIIHPQRIAGTATSDDSGKDAFIQALQRARSHKIPVILVNTSQAQADSMGIPKELYAGLWKVALTAPTSASSSDTSSRKVLSIIKLVVDDKPHTTNLPGIKLTNVR